MDPVRVILFGTTILLVLVGGIVSFVIVFMNRQRDQARHVAKLSELHQKELLEASVDAQENVRRQIGADLHDDIGTLLSASRLSLAQLGRQIKEMPEMNHHFSHTNELLNEAVGNVRRISKELMPSSLDKFGLIAAISDFTEKLTTSTGVNVILGSKGINSDRFHPKIELTLYRIIQELTNNSLKHAKPSFIKILLEIVDNTIQLTVNDDGIGFDLAEVMKNPANGIGIRNIESRLSVIDGTVEYDVAKGRGSKIFIKVGLKNYELEKSI